MGKGGAGTRAARSLPLSHLPRGAWHGRGCVARREGEAAALGRRSVRDGAVVAGSEELVGVPAGREGGDCVVSFVPPGDGCVLQAHLVVLCFTAGSLLTPGLLWVRSHSPPPSHSFI